MKDRIEQVAVPKGYHCPLCPDHLDTSFFCHALIPVSLCDACLLELDHFALKCYLELPPEWQQHAAVLETLTGRSWRELRTEIIREQLDHWTTLQWEKSGRWLDVMMKQGWSLEGCEQHIDQQVATFRVALEDATIESEAHRRSG